TLPQAAQVLGIRENALRAWLRDNGHLNKDGTLAAKHVGAGNLFMEPRVTQPKHLGYRKHYAVLKVTERGVDWLAQQMGIEIKESRKKDTAASARPTPSQTPLAWPSWPACTSRTRPPYRPTWCAMPPPRCYSAWRPSSQRLCNWSRSTPTCWRSPRPAGC